MFGMDQESKEAKLQVLQEIMKLMDDTSSGRLKGKMKPSITEIEVSKPKLSVEPSDPSDHDQPQAGDDDIGKRLAQKLAQKGGDPEEAAESPAEEMAEGSDEDDMKKKLMDMYSRLK